LPEIFVPQLRLTATDMVELLRKYLQNYSLGGRFIF